MSTEARAPLSVLDEILCTALAVGLVLVALLPGARGVAAVGWLPMWLVAMPALAWWALHGFAMPRRRATVAVEGQRRASANRRVEPQARRSAWSARHAKLRRAA